MKKVILILLMSLSFINFTNANDAIFNQNSNDIQTVIIENTDCELLSLMNKGIITSLTVAKRNLDECTLSATVSYNGASTTLSITAEDCYKAGAGIAQAVRGFMDEVNNR